ncbi:PREDICTED: CD99 antigen-like protein 2 isoform X4 [Hipposideros armiger]|uniref:CD99 antigen-like protein 2 n=1 Tax=Hipposideros armiger TaxID=186990 RepID=A0A8B7TFA9_HIPAR|nr:PREDICTED: CD99 antigen-like protein 2 isoform X4 [Hipposideros armiger]
MRAPPALRGRAGSGRVLRWQRSPPPAAPPLSLLLPNFPRGRSRANCAPLGPLHLLLTMVAWHSAFLVCLAFSLATLIQRGSGDWDDFNRGNAWKETTSVKQRWDHVTTTTKRPGTTRAPAKPAAKDFDLADALDDQNDRDGGRRKPNTEGGGFSDKDLEDVLGGGDYKPDKGRGDDRYGSNDDSESGMSPETGTIAGVASALAMALIGAVSSYISYQQKKFCFRIQQGLNADYVKGENLEAVVCEEPQVQFSALPPQSAEPPQPQPPRI